ncbi:hypothetical protein [Sphingomonas crusticola]|uniref:hypothetical protein n=1 Tax=Sphingomonas crusticola TaxID=1697973 RepID=UPI000E23B76B|nr:hypothetical protein [Sphingomonas crusticola]
MSKPSKSSKPKAADNDTSNGALTDAYGKVSDRVAAAYAAAREKTAGAGQSLEANPLSALLGGIAIGAIAGALLPRIEKEKELLDPLGAKIGDAARAALDAGRSAGLDALDEAGLSTDQLRGQVSKLVEQALKAAGTAGTAAIQAARESATR